MEFVKQNEMNPIISQCYGLKTFETGLLDSVEAMVFPSEEVALRFSAGCELMNGYTDEKAINVLPKLMVACNATGNHALSYTAIDMNVLKKLGIETQLEPWIDNLVVDWNGLVLPSGSLEKLHVNILNKIYELKNIMVLNLAKKKFPFQLILGSSAPLELINMFSSGPGSTSASSDFFDVFHIPEDIWYKIFGYMNQPSQKAMRAVHPYFYRIMKRLTSFGSNTHLKVEDASFTIFQDILNSDFKWKSLGLQICRCRLEIEERIPDQFFTEYSNRLSSLEFSKCLVDRNENGEQEFFLSWIVNKCNNLRSLTIGGCPNFFDDEFDDHIKWLSIKCLTVSNDCNLTITFARQLFDHLGNLEELAVVGNRWKISGKKADQKYINNQHLCKWKEECEVIMKVFVPLFIRRSAYTLTKLNFAYHPMLISETNFIFDLFAVATSGGFNILESLNLAMCDFPLKLLSQLLENIPSIKNLTCSIVAHKCKHDPQFSNQYSKFLTKSVCFKLESLTINYSKRLFCLCFLRNGDSLKHVNVSYNHNINSKQVEFKERGIHLKSFIFAGNESIGFRIRELLLWNLTHLDLSFSKCVQNTEDLNHICEHMKQLEILKLSGSPGQLNLHNLQKLNKLRELRLRSCLDIRPIEFQENIILPLLETLDLADTLLSYTGMLSILENHLRLKFFDVRSCTGITYFQRSTEIYAFIPRICILFGKLKPKRQPQYERFDKNENINEVSFNPTIELNSMTVSKNEN